MQYQYMLTQWQDLCRLFGRPQTLLTLSASGPVVATAEGRDEDVGGGALHDGNNNTVLTDPRCRR